MRNLNSFFSAMLVLIFGALFAASEVRANDAVDCPEGYMPTEYPGIFLKLDSNWSREYFIWLPSQKEDAPVIPSVIFSRIDSLVADLHTVPNMFASFHWVGTADTQTKVYADLTHAVKADKLTSKNCNDRYARKRGYAPSTEWGGTWGYEIVEKANQRGIKLFVDFSMDLQMPSPPTPIRVDFRNNATTMEPLTTEQAPVAELIMSDSSRTTDNVFFRALSDSISVDSTTALIRAGVVPGIYNVVAYHRLADSLRGGIVGPDEFANLPSDATMHLVHHTGVHIFTRPEYITDTLKVTVLKSQSSVGTKSSRSFWRQIGENVSFGIDGHRRIPVADVSLPLFGDPQSSFATFGLHGLYGRDSWLNDFVEVSQAGFNFDVSPFMKATSQIDLVTGHAIRKRVDFSLILRGGIRQSAFVRNDPTDGNTYTKYKNQFLGYYISPGVQIGPITFIYFFGVGELDKRTGPGLRISNLNRNARVHSFQVLFNILKVYQYVVNR